MKEYKAFTFFRAMRQAQYQGLGYFSDYTQQYTHPHLIDGERQAVTRQSR